MSATNATLIGRLREDTEPLLGRIIAVALFILFLITFSLEKGSVETVRAALPHLLVWTLLILVMNLLPVGVDDVQLTLDLPLLLAAAMLYGPESAALVGFVATVDSRQVAGRRPGLWRSLFNRSQVALSIWVAGVVFSLMSPGLLPLTVAIPALATALIADYLVNTGTVALHVAATRRIRLRESARRLVEHPLHFVATYLGYGALSLVLAILYERVGLWSVVAFLLPLVGARQLLLKGQALEELAEVLRRHEQLLRRALDQVEGERRNERKRIAGDLHDEVLQSLTHVRMLGRLLEKKLQERSSRSSGSVREDVHDMRVSADRAIEELRDVIAGLSSSELVAEGLVPTLHRLLERLRSDWRVDIQYFLPQPTDLGGDLDLAVYQVMREAVLNALKHSHATRIEVRFSVEADKAVVEVRDDGVGFSPSPGARVREGSFGLGLVHSRVRGMGGEVTIDSYPGKGTRLRVTIPVTRGD